MQAKRQRDRYLEFLVYLMLLIAVANFTLSLISPRDHHHPKNNTTTSATPDQKQDNLLLGISPEGWTAIFTGLLTFSTIGLWVVTWWTLDHAREDSARQAKDNRISMRLSVRATNAARKAANAADLSAKAAIGAERAWLLVTIDSDNLEDAIMQWTDPTEARLPERPKSPSILFHFDNRGKTPAFIQELAAELVISTNAPDPSSIEPLAPWWPNEIVISNGERFPSNASGEPKQFARTVRGFRRDEAIRLDPEITEDVSEMFWFFGYVIYFDVWNNRHETRFCFANQGFGSDWCIPKEAGQYNVRT